MHNKVILCIMDGYGLRTPDAMNAVTLAKGPHLKEIFADYPKSTLKTSGLDVGLPAGQMGNSEVGHLNIGAGRIVYQDISRIDLAIESGEFFRSPVLNGLLEELSSRNRRLHLLGLVSTGGVHSSMNHLRAILELCLRRGFRNVVLHAFTDGRDTPPNSGVDFLRQTEIWMRETGIGKVVTVSGRYYAMDRDKRWDRVEKAYRALCFREGKQANTAEDAIQHSYESGVTDEFILPTVINSGDDFRVTSEDGIFFFNFRSDRTRQLADAFTSSRFDGFDASVKVERFVSMTRYREEYTFPVVFPPSKMTGLLGEAISNIGLKQLRIAETEKYPHVTFFFNGGEETPCSGEDRIMVPSPKVATYDLKPEMSEPEVTRKLCEAIRSKKYDLIVVNFANCDMVGHTGLLAAAIRAVEAVDDGVGRMWSAAKESGYAVLLTSDHGNAETMWDDSTNGPHTAHTTNDVPLCLMGAPEGVKLLDGGRLADIAPTILALMNVSVPQEMTGKSLLGK